MKILYKYSKKCVNRFPQASSFFIRACFHIKKLNTENLELIGDICGNRERKTWRGVNSTPQLKWGKSDIQRGHTMVLYFK